LWGEEVVKGTSKGGAGYGADICFMAVDVSEKYQSHIDCLLERIVGGGTVINVVESYTLARQIPTTCYPHSFITFQVSVY
jgi:hypothetical protein